MTRISDELTTRTTQPRQTPRTGSDAFRDALASGASQLLAGVEQVAGLVPGGQALTAAIRGGSSGSGSGVGSASLASTSAGGTSPEGPGGGLNGPGTGGPSSSDMLAAHTSSSMELLVLQQEIAMEQRSFQTVSNVMKARHDTAKAVIGNVR